MENAAPPLRRRRRRGELFVASDLPFLAASVRLKAFEFYLNEFISSSNFMRADLNSLTQERTLENKSMGISR